MSYRNVPPDIAYLQKRTNTDDFWSWITADVNNRISSQLDFHNIQININNLVYHSILYTTTPHTNEYLKNVGTLSILEMLPLHPKRPARCKLRCYRKTAQFHILVYTIFATILHWKPVRFVPSNMPHCHMLKNRTILEQNKQHFLHMKLWSIKLQLEL